MTSFLLKIIAVFFMLLDHIGVSIVGKFTNLNLWGRIAFPIFAYQAVQGYIHTRNIKKHLLKLFIFACISQLPFALFLSTFSNSFNFNIFFTFLLGLIALLVYDKCKNKFLGFLFVILASIVSQLLNFDYGAFGILLIFNFYFFEKVYPQKFLMLICTTILCFSKYIYKFMTEPQFIYHYFLCAIFTSLSLFFILLYNKKEGPKAKYFFYIFYPLHLTILYLIHTFAL